MASGGEGPADGSPDWADTSIDLSSPGLAKASASMLDSGEDFEVLDEDDDDDLSELPPLEDIGTGRAPPARDDTQVPGSEQAPEEVSNMPQAAEEWLDVLGKILCRKMPCCFLLSQAFPLLPPPSEGKQAEVRAPMCPPQQLRRCRSGVGKRARGCGRYLAMEPLASEPPVCAQVRCQPSLQFDYSVSCASGVCSFGRISAEPPVACRLLTWIAAAFTAC